MKKPQGEKPAWPELRVAWVGAADTDGGGHGSEARFRDATSTRKELVEGIRSGKIR
jgi:hypothetical protein